MPCCTARRFALAICVLQMVATIVREVFDFLGYMWTPIIGNFLQIICVILGIFGIYHYRVKYLVVYGAWSLLWIGCNVFVICFYLEVGSLSRDSGILNIGTGGKSWFATRGIGCESLSNLSLASEGKLSTSDGCLLEYPYVECIQAGVQCFLAFLGFVEACYIIYQYSEEDDSSTRRIHSTLPYSIEYHTYPSQDPNSSLYQRPMTPRKVKRRSTRAKRGYRQSYYQNPVTKLMDRSMDTSSNDSFRHNSALYYGQSNPLYSNSRPNSFAYSSESTTLPVYLNNSETVI